MASVLAWTGDSTRGREGEPRIAQRSFIPRARLFSESISVDVSDSWRADYREVETPLICLFFDYDGQLVRCSDRRARLFRREDGNLIPRERDLQGEARAMALLESFGAVEISYLDEYGAAPDSDADYVVQVDGDANSQCAFTAYAVPRLQALGWQVDIADDYPFQVVDTAVPWYANVDSDDEQAGWFSLELGVDIEGERVNLLPALLELLEGCPDSATLEALARRARKCVALPLDDRRYVPVPSGRLKSLLQVLRDLYDGDPDLRIPAARATCLSGLDEVFSSDESDGSDSASSLDWSGDSDAVRTLETLRGAQPRPVDDPVDLRATLRPYQKEGLAWLTHLRDAGVCGVLADDMGLGKTLQTIAHIVNEKQLGRARQPVLVVAPTSLVGNWQSELKKFAPHLSVSALHGPGRHARRARALLCDVVITTFPLLIRDLDEFAGKQFSMVILDEAQTIKNHRSQAHKAVCAIEADHRLCLSGTPVENNLDELWSLFHFLMPGMLGDPARFRTSFRLPIERDGDSDRMEVLRERVSPFILRRLKNTVARDLPPKTDIALPIELAGAQRELYESIRVSAHDQVRQAIRSKGIAASTVQILDALMKLRQVCCDPRLVALEAARRVENSAKFETLFELLPQQLAEGRRVLLFSQFTSMLGLIGDELRNRGIAHVALTGSTANRQAPIDAFEGGEADVFLISLKAGGTGLNLTSADTVIHYDPWWNPAAQAQATDRAYRIGQTRPVFVYNLVVAGSVEERMVRLQQRKQALANSLLAGPDQRAGGGLSAGEVDGLFAPLSTASED